jgi:hypothetical protein
MTDAPERRHREDDGEKYAERYDEFQRATGAGVRLASGISLSAERRRTR